MATIKKFLKTLLGSTILGVLGFALCFVNLAIRAFTPGQTLFVILGVLFGAMLFFSGLSHGIMMSKRPEAPISSWLCAVYVWALWRFAGLREVDETALPGFLGDGGFFRVVPLSLYVCKDGTPIVTQALIEVTEEEKAGLEGEGWKS